MVRKKNATKTNASCLILSRLKPTGYLPTIVAILATMMIGTSLIRLENRLLEREAVVQTSAQLDFMRSSVENHMEQWAHILRNLGHFVSKDDALTQEAYAERVRVTVPKANSFISIAWAPDLVVRHIYPVEGNEATLGMDYRSIPDQIAAVMESRYSGQFVIVGPVDLIQGGRGIIMRLPVIRQTEDAPRFMGIISVVLDPEEFFGFTGFLGATQGYDLAVTSFDNLNQREVLIAGKSRAMTDGAISTRINLYGVHWTIYTRPMEGWTKAALAGHPGLRPFQLTVILFSFMIVLATAVANWFAISRQEMLDAIHLSDKRLKGIIDNAPGVFLNHVTDGTFLGRIDFVTENCVELWELSDEQLYDDPTRALEMIDPDHRGFLRHAVERSRVTLQPWHYTWRITTPSGAQKWIDGRGVPSRLEDGGTRWDSFLVDVTEEHQRKVEFERQSAIAEQAQKQEVIGKLSGGVAHDFNNLLAIIQGNLELLRDEIARDARTEDERLFFLKQALSAIRRGADLTRNMLSFARRSKLFPKEHDLNEMVRELESWTRRTLPETISLEIDLARDLPLIRVDRSSAESAILNLIINARDAMPDGGTLTMKTEVKDALPDDGPDVGDGKELTRYVVLSVSDSGAGITPRNLAKIFDPFFTTKEPGKGSGLGLSMIQGFMEQSDGMIRVWSQPGQGSSFRLYFRALDKNAVQAAPAVTIPDTIVPTPPMRILVAEDEDAVRSVIGAGLEKLGHSVQAAPSGDEALELFQKDPGFELLVTDIVMPGELQGTDLAREVRKLVPDVPVVFMTGYSTEAVHFSEEMGPNEVRLMKPVQRSDLARAIAMVSSPANGP